MAAEPEARDPATPPADAAGADVASAGRAGADRASAGAGRAAGKPAEHPFLAEARYHRRMARRRLETALAFYGLAERGVAPGVPAAPSPADVAADCERAMYNAAVAESGGVAAPFLEAFLGDVDIAVRGAPLLVPLLAAGAVGGADLAWATRDPAVREFAADPRARTRRMLARCLERAGADAAAAAEIERSCYNTALAAAAAAGVSRPGWEAGLFSRYYALWVGKVAANLDPRSSVGSAALAGRLRAGAVAPAALGTMSGTEMCPEATADIRAELERRARCEVARRVSRMYRCPRCHERACIYAAKRMSLGGDEATGLAIECTVCGHAWKG